MYTISRLSSALVLVMLVAPTVAMAGDAYVAFDDVTEFETFVEGQNTMLVGVETFEGATVGEKGKHPLPAPFEQGTPNTEGGFGFPTGLSQDITIWDNVTPGPSPPTLNPSDDSAALYVVGPGFAGANSIKIGEDLEILGIVDDASVDIVLPTEGDHTAVGFTLSRFDGFPGGGWVITLYDESGTIIDSSEVPPPPAANPNKSFFGVWSAQPIGRINVWDSAAGPAPDAIDEIQIWSEIPTPTEPASWGSIKATYDGDS
jgi:hypothetical protein